MTVDGSARNEVSAVGSFGVARVKFFAQVHGRQRAGDPWRKLNNRSGR